MQQGEAGNGSSGGGNGSGGGDGGNGGARRLISSGSPFESQVGYSRAVVDGEWCFVAGTTGPNADGSGYPADVAQQARNALAIIQTALAQGGFSLNDVIRATYYITDAAYWDAICPVLGAAFGTIRPAATCLVCGLIQADMKIEIEVTAKRRAPATGAV
ncbi:MAG: RidA family protein [Sphingopyxis sp.]